MGDQDKEKNMENPDMVQRFRLILMDQSMTCKVKTNTRLSAGSGKEVHWAVDLDFMIGRSNLDFGWMDRLDMVDRFRLYVIILIDELRMVLVKRRSCEGSVSERLCSVLLDDASLRVQLGREVRIGSYMDRVGPFACWRLRSRNPGSPSEDPNGRTWLLVTWTVPDRSPAGDPDRLLGFGASVTDQQERGFFWGLAGGGGAQVLQQCLPARIWSSVSLWVRNGGCIYCSFSSSWCDGGGYLFNFFQGILVGFLPQCVRRFTSFKLRIFSTFFLSFKLFKDYNKSALKANGMHLNVTRVN
ncbi:hypothetical protein DY000_02053537 [Brassica cretica]|uniref:Uncharacterized protein n=1 Tax=Brassica cretica TaxID=69181 RepID=A0ABQ7AEE3_BRACR|nr:hypothetical protein DY000_02053537 [Brassica cretica]